MAKMLNKLKGENDPCFYQMLQSNIFFLTCITKRQREQCAWLARCLTGGAMSPISER